MTVDERLRHLVRTNLEEVHGTEVADALMDMLAPMPWATVATRADVDRLSSDLRGEIAQLRSELLGSSAELRGEMAEVRGEMAELRGEMAELRGEMRGMLPRLYAANFAAMIGIAGLVLAATHLG